MRYLWFVCDSWTTNGNNELSPLVSMHFFSLYLLKHTHTSIPTFSLFLWWEIHLHIQEKFQQNLLVIVDSFFFLIDWNKHCIINLYRKRRDFNSSFWHNILFISVIQQTIDIVTLISAFGLTCDCYCCFLFLHKAQFYFYE